MVTVVNLTKRQTPQLPWEKIKNRILGENYSLSIVLAGSKKMQDLNKRYRDKNEIANTLSFALSKKEGEIFLNINQKTELLPLLFIHSLLHLKGMRHGKNMEKKEKKYKEEFKF